MSGDGVGEFSGPGGIPVPDIFDLDIFGFCNCPSPACVCARRSCVNLSFSAVTELRSAGLAINAFICSTSRITSRGWGSRGAVCASAVDLSCWAKAFTVAESLFTFSSKAFILLSNASSCAFCCASCCWAAESCFWHAQMMMVSEVRIDGIRAFFMSGVIAYELCALRTEKQAWTRCM